MGIRQQGIPRMLAAVTMAVATACATPAGVNLSGTGPQATGGLPAPSNLHIEVAGPSSVLLLWDLVDEADGIRVERQDGTDAPFAEVGVTGPGSVGHLNTGLTPGSTYTWRLRACHGSQCSPYSPTISYTVHA